MRLDDPFQRVPAVVAIPVRDETERIGDCLSALARQKAGPPGVLLLVNNTTDATVQTVNDMRQDLAMPLVVIEHQFPPAQASAGQARRLAMDQADRLAPPDVPLLCTDADGRVAPDWLAANLAHLNRGIDAVFGRIEIDPLEAAQIPPALHQADAAECAYGALLDEIEHLIDPDPDDPQPRHIEHSGASIAIARAMFARIGGIPGLALGEDRAVATALRRADARIRHAPEVRVMVSGRILGRAVGGMADTIRRRLVAPDLMLDDALEPASARLARVRLRRSAREGFRQGRAGDMRGFVAVAARVGIGRQDAELLGGLPSFGLAWTVLDAALPRRPVAVVELCEQMKQARALLEPLHARSEIHAFAG